MNHIYHSIWNPSTGTCVAASELVSGTGKAASTTTSSQGGRVRRFRCRQLTCALMVAFGAMVQAQPTGGVVSSGRATLGGTAAQMTVTQTTPHVVLNWQSFGIQAGESVQFVQPDSHSVALNRVMGADPSNILGNLSSNGQVFLVNPNGILFGPNASVNVGGLVASTLNIGDADFMSGYYRFSGAGAGAVVNQGLIRAASGGYVALLGSSVSNPGVVMAQLGSIALAAGNAMTLDVTGDQLLNVAIDQGVVNALVRNGGLLQADGGHVLMSTQVAGNLLANAVNNTGVVQAQSLESRNGTIVLLGSMDVGTVSVGGTLDVRGGVAETGGRVVVTAHQVGLLGAQIQASGDAGGGVVLVGGDYQGQNPAVPHASAVYMSQDSAIHADANSQGDGGRVVLWANHSTRASGHLSARGGAQSGNGGLIETSGHALDVSSVAVDTRATHGLTGTWLLDPADVTISSAATTDATRTGSMYEPNSGVSAANVNVADLVTALGTTNVTVTTANAGVGGSGSGDIHVNAALTWVAPTTLTLTAARDVKVNQAITGTDGSLVVNAGRDATVAAAITTTTGGLSFTAVQDVNLNAVTTITTGNLSATAGRHVNVSAASTITTGNMVFRADSDGTGPGASAGTVAITCVANCLTVTKGVLDIRFNPVSYATTSSEISTYASKLTGGGTLNAKAWEFGLGDNKTYDGSQSASVSGLKPDTSGVAAPVALGVVNSASFDSQHVGTAKPITFTTTFADAVYALFANVGASAGTYQARADVVARPLTVTASNVSKVYGQTPALTGFTTSTLANSETVGSVTQTSTGQAAAATVAGGPYPIVASHATGGTFTPSNYTISYVNGALTVTAVDGAPPVIAPPSVVGEPSPVVVVPPDVPPTGTPDPVVPPLVTDAPRDPSDPGVAPHVIVESSWAERAAIVSGEQATTSHIPAKDGSPVLFIVSPGVRMAQGPLTFPAIADPVVQQEKPPLRLRVLPIRVPKQDRN